MSTRSSRLGNAIAGATTIYMSQRGAGPNASAATNTQAIQAALTACNAVGGGTVVLDRPGTYQIDATLANDSTTINYTTGSALVMYSNTALVLADGVTLKLANASNCYTIRNYACGTGTNGTYSTYDQNITIAGGKLDFNGANQTGSARGAGIEYWKHHGIWMDFVNGFDMTDVEMIGGKKFCVWITNCYRARADGLYIHDTLSDGYHIGGGNTDVVVSNCTITALDNGVPIVTNEGGYYTAIVPPNARFDGPHGHTSQVIIKDCYFPFCFEPLRFVGGAASLGTDNITDVLIENCSGTSSTTAWCQIGDDISVSPNISGALIRNLTFRNCRFSCIGNNFGLYINANGARDIRLENCTNPNDTAVMTVSTSASGANATAYTLGELVTEETSGATGYFLGEISNQVTVKVLSGTFTGTATKKLTGALSGAIRTSITTTATFGMSFVQIGARVTGLERLSIINCRSELSYTGFVNNLGGVVDCIEIVGCQIVLGASGRVFQNGATTSAAVTSLIISGCDIKGASASGYADSVLRLDASTTLTAAAVTGNTIRGVAAIIDTATTNLATINLSGNSFTGYGSNYCVMVWFNRGTTAKLSLGGAGNHYTDYSSGWTALGVYPESTGAGYLKLRNPSLKIAGRQVTAGTPSLSKGDQFDNTDTSTDGRGTAWGTITAGPVIYNGTAWEKHGRTL